MNKPSYFVIRDNELEYYGPKPKSDIEAIDRSIIKWLILEAESAMGNLVKDGAGDTCGLCLYFNGKCAKCPVNTRLDIFPGEVYTGCDGTPYVDYKDAIERGFTDDAKLAATAELKMLRRIRAKLLKGSSK